MHDVLADGRAALSGAECGVIRSPMSVWRVRSIPHCQASALCVRLVSCSSCTVHAAPERITLDNDPECTAQVRDAWAYYHEVARDFVDSGRPMQNGSLERYNGTFRDERLSVHWIRSLADTWRIIEDGKVSDNAE